jgi:hypothetical protein
MSINKTDEYYKKCIEKHGNKYDYSLLENIKKRECRVDIICPKHGSFNISLHKHICGDGCKKCGVEKTTHLKILKAKNKFIQEANTIHNNKYDYSKFEYISAKNNIIIICPLHGTFEQTPNSHLSGNGCKKCSNNKVKEIMSIPWNIYKEDLQNIHNNKYDYSKVAWKGVDIDIIVICPIHRDFEIRPADHKRGRGCQKCSKETHIQYNKLDTDNFIEKSIQIWGNKYNYSKTNYLRVNDKVIIICDKHGEFEQLPSNHYKYGCGSCGREANIRNNELKDKCKNEFEIKSNNAHNNFYDYTQTNYIDAKTNVIIICKEHGEFSMTPNNHLRGRGCPKCFNHYSKSSILWLDFLSKYYNINIQHAENDGEYLIPKTKYKADGFCKENNTIYEFHGDYWHGNPNIYKDDDINTITKCTYKELYDNTLIRENKIKDLGYNLVVIWENDWKKINKCVKILQQKFRKYNY